MIAVGLALAGTACSSRGPGGGCKVDQLVEPCSGCLQRACTPNMTACFGERWRERIWGGECGAYISCLERQGDIGACFLNCTPTVACDNCAGALRQCQDLNCVAECLSGFRDAGFIADGGGTPDGGTADGGASDGGA